MLDRTQRLRRGALTAVGMATAVVVLAGCGGTGDRTTTERAAPGRSGGAQDPQPDVAVLLDRGRHRCRRHRRDDLRRAAVPGEAGRGAQPGADARQHRARGQLDDHPVADPRGHGRADGRDDLRPGQDARRAPTSCTSRSTARQWWWQYEYTDKDTSFDTANEMHIPVGRPVRPHAHQQQRDPLVLDPGARTGKKDVVPGRPNTSSRSRPTGPARSSASAPSTAASRTPNMRLRVIAQTEADYEAWVERSSRRRSRRPPRTSSTSDLDAKWGCATCHSITSGSEDVGATIGPNLTHLGDRQAFAGDIYPMKLDELTKWIYDAPGAQAAWATSCGWMPNFEAARHDRGRGREDREVPAVRHRHRSRSASGVPLT